MEFTHEETNLTSIESLNKSLGDSISSLLETAEAGGNVLPELETTSRALEHFAQDGLEDLVTAASDIVERINETVGALFPEFGEYVISVTEAVVHAVQKGIEYLNENPEVMKVLCNAFALLVFVVVEPDLAYNFAVENPDWIVSLLDDLAKIDA